MQAIAHRHQVGVRGPLPQVTLVICLSALAFALRIPSWARPFNMDEGLYAYGAWRMLDGLVIYRDLFDFKPPGIYFLHALNFWLTAPEATNVYVCASLFSAGSTAGVYCIARHVWGTPTAVLAGLLFVLLSSSPFVQGNGVNSEVFMLLPYVWSLYFALRAMEDSATCRPLFVSGLLAGVAAVIKQVGGIGLLIGLMVIAWNMERHRQELKSVVRSGFMFLCGFIAPWTLSALYFWAHGALDDFTFWVFGYPFHYMRVTHANISWPIFLARASWMLKGILPFWLLSVGACIAIAVRRSDPKATLIVLFLLFSVVAAAVGWNFYPHYFIQASPALALLSGQCLILLFRRLKRRPSRPLVAAAGCVMLLGVSYHIVTHFSFYTARSGAHIARIEHEWSGFGDTFAVAKEVGLYLKATTGPDDTVFVWMQSPEINFYALRKTPARAPIMSLPWPGLDEVLLQDLLKDRPSYVVIFDGHPLPKGKVTEVIARDYTKTISLPEPTSGTRHGAYGIYRLKPQLPG